jgi:hypothetical protein
VQSFRNEENGKWPFQVRKMEKHPVRKDAIKEAGMCRG